MELKHKPETKVLLLELCLQLLDQIPATQFSIRENLRQDARQLVKELLREYKRDVLREGMEGIQKNLWQMFRSWLIPSWLEKGWAGVLHEKEKKENDK